MSNHLVCLEGTVDFEEEIANQAINIVSFRQGQQITISRDPMSEGCTLTEHMSRQLFNAQQIFTQFEFIESTEISHVNSPAKTVKVAFTYLTNTGQRLWQVTIASLISERVVMNFTSVYPDEENMNNQVHRLMRCVNNFSLNQKFAYP